MSTMASVLTTWEEFLELPDPEDEGHTMSCMMARWC